MTRMIFVNLPVADLPRSMPFYGALGFTINPVQDHGFMYGRDLADPNGHIWGPFWMDPEAMPESA